MDEPRSAEPRFLTRDGEPRAFVIVSSARSGSNLLVTYLRQVRRAACFGEILRSEFPNKVGWDRLVERLGLSADARRLHAQDLTAFWELFLSQGLRSRRWVGAKAFYYHRRDDAVWDRFGAADHRVIHLWRDATFDQYVSRLLAGESGQWKARDGASVDDGEPRVTFDPEEYLRYRAQLRSDILATRARYGGVAAGGSSQDGTGAGGSSRDEGPGRAGYEEIEYRQLSDHAHVAGMVERLFGERIEVTEVLRRQRVRPKIEYVANPAVAEPYLHDSISGGFAEA